MSQFMYGRHVVLETAYYCIESGGAKWITHGVPDGTYCKTRHYDPMDRAYSGLFRKFAFLEPSEVAVSEFATQYGFLRGGQPSTVIKDHATWQERLSLWIEQIGNMRRAVRLWDAIHDRDAAILQVHIRQGQSGNGTQRWYYVEEGERDQVIVDVTSELAQYIRPGDLFFPALVYIQRLISDNLADCQPRLLLHTRSSKLGLHIVPNNLAGALWLQLARAIDGNKNYRSCRACGEWFELTPESHRSHADFCNTNCRSRFYRKKKADAKVLYGEGWSVAAIADKLDSKPEVVQGWLKDM